MLQSLPNDILGEIFYLVEHEKLYKYLASTKSFYYNESLQTYLASRRIQDTEDIEELKVLLVKSIRYNDSQIFIQLIITQEHQEMYESLLEVLSQLNHIKFLELLIKYGRIHYSDHNYFALYESCRNGYLDQIELFMKYNDNSPKGPIGFQGPSYKGEVVNDHYYNCLKLAGKNGYNEIAILLYKHKPYGYSHTKTHIVCLLNNSHRYTYNFRLFICLFSILVLCLIIVILVSL